MFFCFLLSVVIDKRKDPNANTGLFELVYKQNLPRIPPYLGMNLSVRGRKLFRKSKMKQHRGERVKEMDHSTQIWLNRKLEFLRNEQKRSQTAPVSLPKIPSSNSYKGPVIEDLIDGLNKKIINPQIIKIDDTKTLKSNHHQKKFDSGKKRERVSKKKTNHRCKSNKITFVSRKQNAKENINAEEEEEGGSRKANNYLGLFKEWRKGGKSDDFLQVPASWERGTASILKGNYLLNGAQMGDDIGNKNCLKNNDCFNLNLLPHITANSSSSSSSTSSSINKSSIY